MCKVVSGKMNPPALVIRDLTIELCLQGNSSAPDCKVGILTAVFHTGRWRCLEVISTCEEAGGRAHFSFMNVQSIQ